MEAQESMKQESTTLHKRPISTEKIDPPIKVSKSEPAKAAEGHFDVGPDPNFYNPFATCAPKPSRNQITFHYFQDSPQPKISPSPKATQENKPKRTRKKKKSTAASFKSNSTIGSTPLQIPHSSSASHSTPSPENPPHFSLPSPSASFTVHSDYSEPLTSHSPHSHLSYVQPFTSYPTEESDFDFSDLSYPLENVPPPSEPITMEMVHLLFKETDKLLNNIAEVTKSLPSA